MLLTPSSRRDAGFPSRQGPRVAAPAPLRIVPIPILGTLATTTLPEGALPGAGLKGGGSRQIGMAPPMTLPALPRS
ncbi:MAG: hypothetical protein K0S14_974 [Thermomicrobiales bacterium]|jgi:hypothetical protein|nr:hypothetical protein [Thermomicrobiales bacterium]MCD6057295.1 hypothetical protein [Thermomicrobiales bacterium]MDF3015343.1 hypothetical protein [Thermomicrobiales bacterium]